MTPRGRGWAVVGTLLLVPAVIAGVAVARRSPAVHHRPDLVSVALPTGASRSVALRWSADGQEIYAISGPAIDVVSASTLAPVTRLATGEHSGATFSPDGTRVALWGPESGIELWDLPSRSKLIGPYGVAAHQPAWSPDGNAIAVPTPDSFEVWDVGADQPRPTTHPVNLAGPIEALGWIGNPDRVIVLNEEAVELWDVETGRRTGFFPGGGTTPMVVSPTGATMAIGGARDATHPQVLRISDGKHLGEVATVGSVTAALDWSPDGAWLFAATTDDDRPRLFDAARGTTNDEYRNLRPGTAGGAWSHDGHRVAIVDAASPQVVIEDVRVGDSRRLDMRASSSAPALRAVWSPDGTALVAIDSTGVLSRWMIPAILTSKA
jgi:WD40 repeat protein